MKMLPGFVRFALIRRSPLRPASPATSPQGEAGKMRMGLILIGFYRRTEISPQERLASVPSS